MILWVSITPLFFYISPLSTNFHLRIQRGRQAWIVIWKELKGCCILHVVPFSVFIWRDRNLLLTSANQSFDSLFGCSSFECIFGSSGSGCSQLLWNGLSILKLGLLSFTYDIWLMMVLSSMILMEFSIFISDMWHLRMYLIIDLMLNSWFKNWTIDSWRDLQLDTYVCVNKTVKEFRLEGGVVSFFLFC